MGRELTAIVVISLFLVGLIGIGVTATNTDDVRPQIIDNESAATVTVSGSGEVTADPDQARVAVAVTTTADRPSNATGELANETARLRETLSNESAVSSVTTSSYRLFERGDDGNRTFVARQSFVAVVNDTDAAGSVVDAAVAGGATEVEDVSFVLSDETRQQLRAQAIDRAVADARTEATAVAGSAGVVLGDVRSLSTTSSDVVVPTGADRGGGTVIDGGPVTVRATVQVTYAAATDE